MQSFRRTAIPHHAEQVSCGGWGVSSSDRVPVQILRFRDREARCACQVRETKLNQAANQDGCCGILQDGNSSGLRKCTVLASICASEGRGPMKSGEPTSCFSQNERRINVKKHKFCAGETRPARESSSLAGGFWALSRAGTGGIRGLISTQSRLSAA